MSENQLEKSEMSSVEFSSYALRSHVAPVGSAESVAARIRLAARRLGWSFTRTKDVWYADPRISISGDEIRKIEETTGVRYGRQEIRDINAIIANADALLQGQDSDFYGSFVAAFRSFVGALDRPGTEG